jgi:hypothetical protein
MRKTYLLLVFIGFASLAISQERTVEIRSLKKQSSVSTEVSDTITFPRHVISQEQAILLAQEAFLECPQYLTEQHLEDYKKYASRFVIYEVPVGLYPECANFSELKYKNKCNPTMNYNLSDFNTQTFNPFKYHFSTSLATNQYYRVDGLPYIIELRAVAKK